MLAGYERCQKEGARRVRNLRKIHSTPGRDGMIILLMDHLKNLIESNHLDQETVKEKMESIFILISTDSKVTFYHLYENCLWLSPHPEDSIEARWGLRKCELIRARLKNAIASIDFIERTYRKKDPNYANFSVEHQFEILARLYEEWAKSECQAAPAPAPTPKKGKK